MDNNLLKKIFLGFVLVGGGVGLALALVLLGDKAASLKSENFTGALLYQVSEKDWIKGDLNAAKAVLVEYSDFQCPACGNYYPVLKKLSEDFGDSLVFVYRHFPLSRIHKNAIPAARAAEAAGLQGKFWEMHDMIFETQEAWSNSKGAKEMFVGYAESLGLDLDKFYSDFESKSVEEKVQRDYEEGESLGIQGTPTFYLNGERIQNPSNYGAFKALIEAAIK